MLPARDPSHHLIGSEDSSAASTGELARFLYKPIVFQDPQRVVHPPSWLDHVPFAFWIVDALRPAVFVELGTHSGNSYSSFAQAVQMLKLPTACYAVDTWQGDPQTGLYEEGVYAEWAGYHDRHFAAFSRLIRSTFAEAVVHFSDGTIDLLHIDGYHTYESASADFELWRPKLSRRGVVLLHDINVRERDFGAWRLWEELRAHWPSFAFLHGHGLGVLTTGSELPEALEWLFSRSSTCPQDVSAVRQFFTQVGGVVSARFAATEIERTLRAEIDEKAKRLVGAEAEAASATASLQHFSDDIKTLSDDIKTRESLLEERDATVSALADEVARFQGELSVIVSQRDARGADAALAAQRMATLEAQLTGEHTEHQSTLSHRAQLVAELERRVRAESEQRNLVEAERDRLAWQLGTLSASASIDRGVATALKHRLKAVEASRSWKSVRRLRRAATALGLVRGAPHSFLGRPARLRDASVIAASGLFDEAYYLRQYPNVADNRLSPLAHFVLQGAREGRNPHPLFDSAWYVAQNPDVAASGVNPLVHFVLNGAREGRDPHPLFSAKFYVGTDGDPNERAVNPLVHYIAWGCHEGRSPHPLIDLAFCLDQNPDLAATGADPLAHFLEHGCREGRSPHPLFDVKYYLRQGDDVAATGANALIHYCESGFRQQRSPHPLFDIAYYLDANPDVREAGVEPLTHFLTSGALEGRDPHPFFDCSYYMDLYPDVAADGTNPLVHFVRHGWREGRRTVPSSKTSRVLQLGDVRLEASNPLTQYIEQRRLESRKATADPDPTSVARAERPDSYMRWVREYDTLDEGDRAAIRAHIAALRRRPLISIVVPVYDTEEKYLQEMLGSVFQQIYPYWELCVADDASTEPHVERVLQELAAKDPRVKVIRRHTNGHISAATNSALDLATGEFVALLDHDDLLSERALYEVAVELEAYPDADVFYSDSDNIDDSGRRWGPYFKTDWNPDLMLGHNMVSHLGVYRRSLLERIGRLRTGFEGSQDYDLMLRAAEATVPSRIRHIPAMLYHWRRDATSASFSESSLERCFVAARRAIRGHLDRIGTRAHVESAPKTLSFTRVVYALPSEPPLVSVIVPTRDRADLLARCADGVLTRTDYEPLELVIVDNDSQEPEMHQLLSRLARDTRVRIIQYAGDFNFAAMNNRAVQEARGEIVVLLNNDVDVIAASWLEEMVSQALRPDVGAVGAKLVYPDGRVQHAGVVLGVGHGAAHFFHLVQADDVGYFGFLVLTRRVSAVTAACMALRRSVYLDVGGLDEIEFPVAFNDVDLCLRIGQRGYAVVWTPHAELYHLESATRGIDMDAQHSARFERDAERLRRRWGPSLSRDPYYNANCSILTACFEPGFPPRRPKPWLPFKGRPSLATPGVSRSETLLAPLDRSARIIEIGPSYNPIAPKAQGWNSSTLDHATCAELVEKYRGHPGVDVDRIEEVDFVWTQGSVADAVPPDLHGTFDAFIASHVIEHTTDLVGFLDAAATLLAPSGVVILAVPDKRYCFDYFRPLTTTGQVLQAHAAGRSRHTRRIMFDHLAYVIKNGESGAWGQTPVQEMQFFHSLEEAKKGFSTVTEDPGSPYVDMHAWQFTPSSFELLLLELGRLGETDWLVERITPATGCEFYVWLRRGGQAAAAALTAAEVDRRRLALLKCTLQETREQIDYLVTGEPESTH